MINYENYFFVKTDFISICSKISTKMRNVHNALADVVASYTANVLEYDVIHHSPEQKLWLVNVYNRHAPGSMLQIEVIDNHGIPVCCVLQKINVGRRSMVKFMNRLVDALDV